MTRALITGITGQDGSWLAEALLARGVEVHGLVRRASTDSTSRISALLGQVALHDGDLLDGASVRRVLDAVGPDVVFHLGAQSDVGASFTSPVATADCVGLGTARVLEAVRCARPDARVYIAGSSEVFGEVSGLIDERTPFAPRNPYAVAKVYAVHLARLYRDAYGMHVCVGLLFNHESERRGESFVTRRISRAVGRIAVGAQRELLLGDLDARRDWGYAPDYVDAMCRMMEQPTPGEWIVATGLSHSVREFAARAFAVVGLDAADWVRSDPARRRPADTRDLRGDATRARAELGWAPTVDFDGLVERMVAHDLALARSAR